MIYILVPANDILAHQGCCGLHKSPIALQNADVKLH